MKKKSIAGKISDSINLAKSIKKNKEAAWLAQLKKPLQTMTLDMEAAVSLQKEVQKLKNNLKARKKELEGQVKKLSESRKEVKKAFRKSKKASSTVKKERNPKKPPKSKPEASAVVRPKGIKPKRKSGLPG